MDEDKKLTLVELVLQYLSTVSVARQLFHLFFVFVVALIFTVSWVIIKDYSALVQVWADAHEISTFSNRLKINVANDSEIAKDLERIMQETNGARAYIYRFHNGLAAVNNVPFFFQSMTHESISPGTQRVMPFEQRIPVGIGMKMNMAFLRNDCIVMKDTDKDTSDSNYYYWTSRGARHFVRCPIYMGNGDLFGFVGVDYNREDSKVTDGQRMLRDEADRIAKLYTP